jgi:four helix bundle protein
MSTLAQEYGERSPANNARRDYKDLAVWQKARSFVKIVYQKTASFPQTEMYGLTNQMRRAAVSIPINLAEGTARFSKKEYARFTSISLGSAKELETLCLLAKDLDYLTNENASILMNDLTEIIRMLTTLRMRLLQ